MMTTLEDVLNKAYPNVTFGERAALPSNSKYSRKLTLKHVVLLAHLKRTCAYTQREVSASNPVLKGLEV
jgi:hypothetical protein